MSLIEPMSTSAPDSDLRDLKVLLADEDEGALRITAALVRDLGPRLMDLQPRHEHGFGLAEDRATLSRLLGTVSEREREVLRLRFEQDLTQAEIGEIIGVSQMQVSRLIRQAVARLRLAAQSAPAPQDPAP